MGKKGLAESETGEARARPSKAKVGGGGCSDLSLHEKLQFATRNLPVCAFEVCLLVFTDSLQSSVYPHLEGIENTRTSAVSREQTELEQPSRAKEGRGPTCLRAAHSPGLLRKWR